MVMLSGFLELLNTTGSQVTVFAPTNDAFVQQNMEVIDVLINSPDGTADNLVGFHIVNGTVNFTNILTRMTYNNLAGSLLHGATVTLFTFSPGYSTYNPYQTKRPSPYSQFSEVSLYIHGAMLYWHAPKQIQPAVSCGIMGLDLNH